MPRRYRKTNINTCQNCQFWHNGMSHCEEHGVGGTDKLDWICDDWEERTLGNALKELDSQ